MRETSSLSSARPRRLVGVLALAWALGTYLNAGGEVMPTNAFPGDVLMDLGAASEGAELGYGWSRPERTGERQYRWIKQREADVWFHLAQPAESDLWILAAPLYLHYRRQNIGVYLNDRFVTEWVCPDSPDYAAYRARVPAELLLPGRNRLILRLGYKARVPTDKRDLALAVDSMLLRPAPR